MKAIFNCEKEKNDGRKFWKCNHYRIFLNRRRVLYENLSLLGASYSRGRLIVEGVLYNKYK